jgi:hypothetical protein
MRAVRCRACAAAYREPSVGTRHGSFMFESSTILYGQSYAPAIATTRCLTAVWSAAVAWLALSTASWRRGAVWDDVITLARCARRARFVTASSTSHERLKHVPGRAVWIHVLQPLFDDGKVPPPCGPPRSEEERAQIQRSESWLARTGWKRHGLIEPNERPRGAL